ncbi:hypothetical protein JX265_008635 [Neoarthrinium moseri]|uniref:Helicase ATP-binding domain-containing protein n=1 Tax=Neoarthrinium moseri TaxID=1658444 RepID=A0A9P9WHZ0_9PEZI|nr:hypothetical protein JX265_008635 [Neoarthrinium moseri]
MELRQGILHQTTIQTAKQHQGTYSTTPLAGNKRPSPGLDTHSGVPTHASQKVAFQRASSLGRNVSTLVASTIEVTESGPRNSPEVSEYSQRKVVSATPTAGTDRALSLSHPRYALPKSLVENLRSLGINEIYPWQKHCLMGPGLLNGAKNLVYTAPTGGGKSLVADVLMLKRVLERRDAKALLILPYVALVQEKVRWLRKVVQGITRIAPDGVLPGKEETLWRRRADEDTIRVVGFFGGGKIRATWADFDIGVCTFEKEANTLMNTAIDDCSIANLRAVVLDELHMIDDDHRGYLLELCATKLLSLEHKVQIVGMSATLPNIEVLAQWLGAHRYQTAYRPIPIKEHLVYDSKIYEASSKGGVLTAATPLNRQTGPRELMVPPIRVITNSSHKELQDPVLNAVVSLASETVRSGYGVLIFCSSRAGCEFDARIVSRAVHDAHGGDPVILEKRTDLMGDLRSLPSGLDPALDDTIPSGAGLTTEERDLIADAYDKGILKVIVATCSLAAGINLPMRGRAGRKGKDEVGETYLCCRKNDLEDVIELMNAELPQLSSGLMTDKQRIRRALLEIIAVRLATSRDSMDDYLLKTLLSLTAESDVIREHVESSLSDLIEMEFIQEDEQSGFKVTQLGKAVVASALEPEDGAFVHREMQRALRAFVMDGEMHLLYTFTPVQDFSTTVNWKVFRNEMETLDDSGLRVMSFLGLKPTIINKMAQGSTMKESTPGEREISRIYTRFYLALQLRDLCNEVPIHLVAQKYDMPRGSVQTLAQTCQGFAAGMVKFCEHMDWGMMAAALDHVSDRLKAGARADLLALAQITFIKSRTARVFYDNGFKTVAAVANADPSELVPVLIQAQPMKIRLKKQDEQKYEEKLFAKAEIISNSANRLWQIQMQQDIEEG